MQFDRGYLSPYFITNSDKMTTELDNPYILLHESKLTNLQPMVPLLEAVVQSGRPLMIISEDVVQSKPHFHQAYKHLVNVVIIFLVAEVICQDYGVQSQELSMLTKDHLKLGIGELCQNQHLSQICQVQTHILAM
jgi:chaperonin GroEL (HSP60 family)